MPTEPTVEEEWYKMLIEGEPISRRIYHLHGLLPSDSLVTAISKDRGFR